jgi:hypothetical protein
MALTSGSSLTSFAVVKLLSAGWARFTTAEWLIIPVSLLSPKHQKELDPSLRWDDERQGRHGRVLNLEFEYPGKSRKVRWAVSDQSVFVRLEMGGGK